MDPTFFAAPQDLRAWLEAHHSERSELLVGYYKTGSGRPSITWPESVDQALCFGWIDGVRRGRDAESYTIRFTPRKARSTWSRVNIDRVAELERRGLMTPAGRAAFERREAARSGIYSFEQQRPPELDPEQERRFREHAAAWAFFEAQPPSYRRAVVWWVVSAKREERRARRLEQAIAESAEGRRVAQFVSPKARET